MLCIATSGRHEGEQIGVAKGRQEGKLAGKIQTLQELLGELVSTDEELLGASVTALTTQLQRLRDRLNKRDA